MKCSTFCFAAAATLFAGCDAVVGSTGQDTSFTAQGALNCDEATVTSQDFVQGTETAPVRCGPQSQPIVQ